MKESDSVLNALLCLSPPSPILSPSFMSVSFTSGSIPIFLDGSSELGTRGIPDSLDETTFDSPAISLPSTSTIHAMEGTISVDDSRSAADRTARPFNFSSSQDSIGTFGPSGVYRDSCWLRYSSSEYLDASRTSPIVDAQNASPTKTLPNAINSSIGLPAPDSTRTITSGNALPISTIDDSNSDERKLPSEEPGEIYQDVESGSSPTCGFIASSPPDSTEYVYTQSQSYTDVNQCPDAQHSFGQSLDGCKTFEFPRPAESTCQNSSVVEVSRAPGINDISSVPYEPPSPLGVSRGLECLPWLKDIVIELLIDQEGFRLVQPIFKLTGYSDHARSLHPAGLDCDGGIVEFMPVERKTYNFHYGPFDSLPILRRVMVNKQESRDYITRQASLNIKTNGVYTVRGVENATFSVPYVKEGSEELYAHVDCKMRWKFEYLVGDRRLEKTGKFLDGEKTLTPLTFSCSPLLLHPSQGKKVKLLHLVRKTVAPKLVAEKMELPARMRGPASSPIQSLAQNYSITSHNWNAHRRAQSQKPLEKTILAAQNESLGKDYRRDAMLYMDPVKNVDQHRTIRRRASSAGEHSRHNLLSKGAAAKLSDPPSSGLNYEAIPHPRYILPRSQLNKMIDSGYPTPVGTTPLTPYKPSHK